MSARRSIDPPDFNQTEGRVFNARERGRSSRRGVDHKVVTEFAKADLDMLKEIAPKEVASDGNCADGRIEGEAAEVGMRQFEPMNSRA
jgi:hypothetical protein